MKKRMSKIDLVCNIIRGDTLTLFELAYEWYQMRSDPEVARMFYKGYLNSGRVPNFVTMYCDAIIEKEKEPDWPARTVPVI